MMVRTLLFAPAAWLLMVLPARCDEPVAAKRTLPPPATVEISAAHAKALAKRSAELRARLAEIAQMDPDVPAPDVEIFLKAVDYALAHGEFYGKGDVDAARRLLDLAQQRIEDLARRPWLSARGLVVRGFRSSLDDSVQPYGLVVPESLNLSQAVPLYVWLHGRSDTTTDLRFIDGRMKSAGQFTPDNAIVLHPFGRYCNGYKSAGEIDVLEAIAAVERDYPIDKNRIALCGFSMGGAGAWHLGAHYTDRFAVVHCGAGFAETARYQNLKPEDYPPAYEQTLWRLYDVPNYVRNLFNVPVIAYSGSEDKQIQAARVMEEAYQSQGQTLTHLIGPGMGHKYHPEVLKKIQQRLRAILEAERETNPERITFQTRTLRYPGYAWAQAEGLEKHWEDSRVDASATYPTTYDVKTCNITRLKLDVVMVPFDAPADGRPIKITIDGDSLERKVPTDQYAFWLERRDGHWQFAAEQAEASGLRKRPGLQGPIDDAFLAPFLVVTPDAACPHPKVAKWVDAEWKHFVARWRMLMRGDVRVKAAHEVTDDDIAQYNLILWGDPASNSLIRRAVAKLPIEWTPEMIMVAGTNYDATHHLPALVYPNILTDNSTPTRYIVLNSGLTFREAHDRTNSLQNPKLPDWAVIDLDQPPDAREPGRIVAADFFDEAWQWTRPR